MSNGKSGLDQTHIHGSAAWAKKYGVGALNCQEPPHSGSFQENIHQAAKAIPGLLLCDERAPCSVSKNKLHQRRIRARSAPGKASSRASFMRFCCSQNRGRARGVDISPALQKSFNDMSFPRRNVVLSSALRALNICMFRGSMQPKNAEQTLSGRVHLIPPIRFPVTRELISFGLFGDMVPPYLHHTVSALSEDLSIPVQCADFSPSKFHRPGGTD